MVACAPKANRSGNGPVEQEGAMEEATSTYRDIDTANIFVVQVDSSVKSQSLMDLPQTEQGGFILTPGMYEATFKSYCLQPGTPDPSAQDAYFQVPMSGYRKDIIETILIRSQEATHLDQKNIQLLLWSVVSGSDFNRLSYDVQYTARELLTQKQVFELKGGVMGIVKTAATLFPETGLQGSMQIKRVFESAVSSYEAFERVAVIREPSHVRRPDFKKHQWYRNSAGYYVRYYPNGYRETKIQVYVPQELSGATDTAAGNYLLFHPSSMVVVPANTNAQKLGIGAPVLNTVRKIIRINRGNIPVPKKPAPKSTSPKTITR
jgi:hypothetical protein